MRGAWPQIIFVSTALHVVVGITVLASTLATLRPPDPPLSPASPGVTMQLTSAGTEKKPQPAVAKATPPVMNAPAPQSPVPAPLVATVAFTKPASSEVIDDVASTVPGSLSSAAPTPPNSVSPVTSTTGPTGALPDNQGSTVFVLDISGSMYEAYGPTTRLAVARKFLSQQIAELRDGTPFALVVYGETALSSGSLVAANAETRASAAKMLNQEMDCGGGTNLPAGLQMAAELNPGRVVLVTDGDLNMDSRRILLAARKALDQPGSAVAFSTVAVAPRAGTNAEALLKKLTKQEGGQYAVYQAGDLGAALTAK